MKHTHKVIGTMAVVLGVLVLAAAGTWFAVQYQERNRAIDSFKSCVAAGNPVMDSYPSKCAADGKTYENPVERERMDAQQAAIETARQYDPGNKVCTQALVNAVHVASGATYTFSNGCLPPGWEPARQ